MRILIEIDMLVPMLANSALQFAFEKATPEGKMVIGTLLIVSLFSWTVIISKLRQLWIARRMAKKFFAAYEATSNPLDLRRSGQEFDGAPAYELYTAAAEEVEYHLQNNPVEVNGARRIMKSSLDAIQLALERASSGQALKLEKGMIVLATAVAGGPFIGLLGTVWGVMDTFAGVAIAKAATLTAMAPGVAGALITTVVGLLVAIPAMFAYNFMVTTIRGITQELDGFASELANAIEHSLVDTRPLAAELTVALQNVLGNRQDAVGLLEVEGVGESYQEQP